MTSSIPDDIARFVLVSIPSVPYLEALLLVRAERDRRWDASTLARRLYLGERAASALLLEMAAAQVMVADPAKEGGFLYRAGPEALEAMYDRVAQHYPKHLVEMTNLIHAKTAKKAHYFADIFRLRRK